MTNLARDLAPQGAATPSLREMANAIRALSMDAVEKANSGHPGMPMGMADAATVLFTKFLKFDPSAPQWPDRDRFVLSAGHGSMLLYSLLYLTGYPEMTVDQLEQFRQLGSRTAGHPEYGHAPGIETTTGPLGQGITTAVGMAIAERLMNARFGDAVCDHYTYAVVGDGCLMEGISQEAIDLAGHLKLNKLIVLWDDNSISIDGSTSLSTSIDQLKRFEASELVRLPASMVSMRRRSRRRLRKRSKATSPRSSPAKPSSVLARPTSRVPRKRTDPRSERMRLRLRACNFTGPIRLSSFRMRSAPHGERRESVARAFTRPGTTACKACLRANAATSSGC